MGRTGKKTIIEFNGLPGTGKSTIARSLESQLISSGVKAIRSYGSIQPKVSFGYWKYCLCICLFSFRIRPLKIRKNGISAFLKYVRMYPYFVKSSSDDVLIIDQGLLQAILSIAHTDQLVVTNSLRRLVKSVIPSDARFIRVDCECSPELSFSRIRERGITGGRLDVMPDSELTESLTVQNKSLTQLRQVFDDTRIDMTAIELDTTVPVEDNVSRILNVIS